jgi:hypothetical protein
LRAPYGPPTCHRACHGPCCILAALGHAPRHALRGRRCPASSMHQRSPHPRRFAARPSRASVRLRPMSQNLLEAKFCAKPSGSSSARPWFTMPTLIPRFTRPSSAPAELSHLMRRGSPAQSLLAMTTVVARAMKTPARHTGCGKEEQPVRRSPMLAACSFRCAPAAVPGGPDTGHASETVMSCAQCPGALAPSMRHMHRANAWRRLVPGPPQSGFRGVELRSTSSMP